MVPWPPPRSGLGHSFQCSRRESGAAKRSAKRESGACEGPGSVTQWWRGASDGTGWWQRHEGNDSYNHIFWWLTSGYKWLLTSDGYYIMVVWWCQMGLPFKGNETNYFADSSPLLRSPHYFAVLSFVWGGGASVLIWVPPMSWQHTSAVTRFLHVTNTLQTCNHQTWWTSGCGP